MKPILAALLAVPSFGETLVFKQVTVIAGAGAPVCRKCTVTVEGDRITAAGKRVRAPRNARVIDGRGRFLIPGLWDMHVHMGRADIFFPLLVANGITGVREMFTGIPMEQIRRWRADPMSPDIVASGFLDGPLARSAPLQPGSYAVATDAEARQAVRELHRRGVDFIKVYASLPRAAYYAILDEARKLGLPVAGHVPEDVGARDAAEAGQRSQEHLIGILEACSTREKDLRAQRTSILASPQLSAESRLRLLAFPPPDGLLDTYSPERAASLFDTFVRNGAWQTPTLVLFRGWARAPDADFQADSRRRFIPRAWTDSWLPKNAFFLHDLSPQDYEVLNRHMRILLERYLRLVRDMRRAGVEFLAGTDTSEWNPALPGFGLHDELALLVEAGFSPAEALATATSNAARYLGREREIGTIEPGKRADMVLLDADPLLDIRNTTRIRGVVLRGRWIDGTDRQALLDRAEAVVGQVAKPAAGW